MYALPFLLIWKLHQHALDARRKSRTWTYYAWSAAAAITGTLIALVAALIIYVFFRVGLWWFAVGMGAFLLTPILGPWFVRRVLVPLGAYRAAYYLGYAARPGKDPAAYGLACAAWALGNDPTGMARSGSPSVAMRASRSATARSPRPH